MNNRPLYLLTFLILALGLGLFIFKIYWLHFPLQPNQETYAYTVEARLFFSARSEEPVKVQLYIPRSSSRFVISNENFLSRGYGLTSTLSEGNRQALWSARHVKGDQYLFYQATVQKISEASHEFPKKKPEVEAPQLAGAQLLAARNLLAEIQEKSADFETFMAELIRILNRKKDKESAAVSSSETVDILLDGKYTTKRRAEVAVAILALHGTPARVVHGLELIDQTQDAKITRWIEAFDGKNWVGFSLKPEERPLPDSYFPWWKGNGSLLDVQGGENVHISLAVKKQKEGAVNFAVLESELKSPWVSYLSLFQLPLNVQGVYRVLLVVPLGALLVALFKNLIGLQTFGTFMPVLIAIAFRETKLLAGLILLVIVLGLGLLIRFGLANLKLLLIPKLAIILTIVIMLLSLISVGAHRLGWEESVSVALFPMVIITMLIERMSLVIEEQGLSIALRQCFWSLVVATLVFLLITNEIVEHLMFTFPELNLVVVAILLLLGRYTGYRLLELKRFASLAH